MDLGRVGVWTFAFEYQPWPKVAELAAELEEMGWGAIWFPEAVGREALSQSALLLSATKRCVIATGIANIYARDPMTSAGGLLTLSEAYPDRFLFGLGVSHAHLVNGLRGHDYSKPYSYMVSYLDAMDKAMYVCPKPAAPPQRALAALGPKMLELSAKRSWGAHPYFVPVEHTAYARKVMGAEGKLAPEMAFTLETDPDKARKIARAHMDIYLKATNYINNLKRLGYADEDIANGGSDRLVDDIVAWGTPEQVAARVAAHHAAGADHVCLQALNDDPQVFPIDQYRTMAPLLGLKG